MYKVKMCVSFNKLRARIIRWGNLKSWIRNPFFFFFVFFDRTSAPTQRLLWPQNVITTNIKRGIIRVSSLFSALRNGLSLSTRTFPHLGPLARCPVLGGPRTRRKGDFELHNAGLCRLCYKFRMFRGTILQLCGYRYARWSSLPTFAHWKGFAL